jgi:hypothetical protein
MLLVFSVLLVAQNREGVRHIEVKKQWVEAARKVYTQTQDAEAKMLIDTILSAMVAVAPVGKEAARVLEPSNPNTFWTFFLSVSPEEMMFSKNVFAEYRPDIRRLMVKDVPCSQLWKGLILLHEAHHARANFVYPYNWRDKRLFASSERDTHNFQNRLMAKVGGSTYNRLLLKEVARLRQEMMARVSARIPGQAVKYMQELDSVFGPALSQEERDTRQTHFWIHAVFVLIEQNKGQGLQAEDGKAAFLFSVYQKELPNP